MTTASIHPQRRRRNHPIPVTVSAALRSRNRTPMLEPSGASCLYASGLSSHARSTSVPRTMRVVPSRAAIAAPKKRKIPIATNPVGLCVLCNSVLVRRSAMLPVTREESGENRCCRGQFRRDIVARRGYCSFAYSALASFRIGMLGSASFQRARKSL